MFYPQLKSAFNQPSQAFKQAVSKVVCVGRNYLEHAKELNNPVPKQPLLFIKSVNSLVQMQSDSKPITQLTIPKDLGECQHELEIAILVGQPLSKASEEQCAAAIEGIGLAIDLTLRDLQHRLKQKGHPWERAKSFDGACPVSDFYTRQQIDPSQAIEFTLRNNQKTIQQGDSRDMIFDIPFLMSNISTSFSLQAGDIILTGTPAGVGPVQKGDQLELSLQQQLIAKAQIV